MIRQLQRAQEGDGLVESDTAVARDHLFLKRLKRK